MKIPKSFTKVTPFSKALALSMLIVFPIVGFWLGIKYQENLTPNKTVYNSSLNFIKYTNKTFLFTFNYPSSFSIANENFNKNGGLLWMSDNNKNLLFLIEKNNLSLEDYIISNPLSSDNLPRHVTKTLANGIHVTGWIGMYRTNIIQYESFTKDGYVYNLGITARSNEDANYNLDSENASLLDQILSTFKFTN